VGRGEPQADSSEVSVPAWGDEDGVGVKTAAMAQGEEEGAGRAGSHDPVAKNSICSRKCLKKQCDLFLAHFLRNQS
jgi:hypothetical protein